MANDISAGSSDPAVREGLTVRSCPLQNGVVTLELIGVLDAKSVHILTHNFNPKNPQILDISRVTSIDQYCMRLLVGMSLDHTFLIRGAGFGIQIMWNRMGMDKGVFTTQRS